MKHFLTFLDVTPEEANHLIARAGELKTMVKNGTPHPTLAGRTLGMIFDKASTRTRISFEVGMYQLGGHALFLHSGATQLGRGEPIEDTARVISRMVNAVMIRTFAHQTVQDFAKYSRVPVINGLTDLTHPCQVLTDVFTYEEHRGSIKGKRVTWVGDGNNMAHSWINGAITFGYQLHITCPEKYCPDTSLLNAARDLGAHIEMIHNPMDAVHDADLVTTDVWASMGQEEEAEARRNAFVDFTVNTQMMAQARPDALFMHCLPAHRGEEVEADVLEGAQSVVWDEAENRLHVQKALLEFLMK